MYIALESRDIIKIIIVAICIVDDRYLHRITMVCVWGTSFMIYRHNCHKTSRRRSAGAIKSINFLIFIHFFRLENPLDFSPTEKILLRYL